MPIDYRAELRRPVSLGLLALAVVAIIVAIIQYRRAIDNRREARQLRATEVSIRSELDQQHRANGTLAEVQAKITGAQQELSKIGETRAQAQTQASAAQQ